MATLTTLFLRYTMLLEVKLRPDFSCATPWREGELSENGGVIFGCGERKMKNSRIFAFRKHKTNNLQL